MRAHRLCIGILLFIALFDLTPLRPATAKQPRSALVIGNAAYEKSPLTNPVNDARDMASALKRFGFDVTLLTDTDRRDMIRAIQTFGDSLTDGSAALVYFSGHGLQSQGNNYLIPLRANITGEADIEFETVDANRILAHLQEENSGGVNIVILDACRDNPFKGFTKSAKSGLAQMDAPTGSLIVYATAPNTAALDDTRGKNSIFTRRLLDALNKTPTLNVLEMLIRVRKQVMKDTDNKQVPWESGSLTDLFYFADAAPTPKPTPQIIYVEVTPTPQSKQSVHIFSLAVRSNVQGDRVYIDGKRYGNTPVNANLSKGYHMLRVEKDNCHGFVENIFLDRTTSIQALLTCGAIRPIPKPVASQHSPQIFPLSVRSNVQGYRVYIDGKRYGNTPVNVNLSKGYHMLRVEKDGCRGFVENIFLQKADTVYANLKCK